MGLQGSCSVAESGTDALRGAGAVGSGMAIGGAGGGTGGGVSSVAGGGAVGGGAGSGAGESVVNVSASV